MAETAITSQLLEEEQIVEIRLVFLSFLLVA